MSGEKKNKNGLKKAAKTAALLLLAALLCAPVVLRFALLTPENAAKVQAETQRVASEALGDSLKMENLRVDLLGRIVADNISLGNDKTGIFKGEKLRISLRLLSLLRDRENPGKAIKSVTFFSPVVHIVRDEAGEWNYRKLFKTSGKTSDAKLPEFDVKMKNAVAVYDDLYKTRPYSVTHLRVEGIDGILKIQREKVLLLDLKGKTASIGKGIAARLRFDLRAGWKVDGSIRELDLDLITKLINSKTTRIRGAGRDVDFSIEGVYTSVGHPPKYSWGGSGNLEGAELDLDAYGVRLKNVSARASLANRSLRFDNGTAEIGGGKLRMNGMMRFGARTVLSMSGEFENVPIEEIKSLKGPAKMKLRGSISGSAEVGGFFDRLKVDIFASGKKLSCGPIKASSGSADISIEGGVLRAGNIVLKSGGAEVRASASAKIENGEFRNYSATIHAEKAQMSEIMSAMKIKAEKIKGGLVTGDLFVSGGGADKKVKAFGTLLAEDVSYSGAASGDAKASFRYDGADLTIENMVLRGDGQTAFARGRISGDEMDIELAASKWSVSTLLALGGRKDLKGAGEALVSGRLGGTFAAPSFSGVVDGGRASVSSFSVDSFTGEIKYANSKLDMSDIRLYTGRDVHNASGGIDFKNRTMNVQAAVARTSLADLAHLVKDTLRLKGDYPSDLSGEVDAGVTFAGSFDKPLITVSATAKNVKMYGEKIDRVAMSMEYTDFPTLKSCRVDAYGGVIEATGRINPKDMEMKFTGHGVAVAGIKSAASLGASATVSFAGSVKGTLENPTVSASVRGGPLSIKGVLFDAAPVNVSYVDNFLTIDNFVMTRGPEKYTASIRYDAATKGSDIKLVMAGADIGTLAKYLPFESPGETRGRIDGQARVFVNAGEMSGGINLRGARISVGGYPLDTLELEGKFEGRKLNINNFITENETARVTANGTIDLDKTSSAKINVSAHKIELARLSKMGLLPEGFGGVADMEIEYLGGAGDASMAGSFVVYDLEVFKLMFSRARGLFDFDGNVVTLKDLKMIHENSRVELVGVIPVREGLDSKFVLKPTAENASLEILNPALERFGVSLTGNATLKNVRITGSLDAPVFSGSVKVSDGSLKIKDLAAPIKNISGEAALVGSVATIKNLQGVYNSSPVSVSGSVSLKGYYPDTFKFELSDVAETYVEYGALYKGYASVSGMEVSGAGGQFSVGGRGGRQATVSLRKGVFVIPGVATQSGEGAEAKKSATLSNITVRVADEMVIRNQKNTLRFEPTGTLTVLGTLAKPEVKGWLSSARGHMRTFGNTFKMTENTIIGFYSLEGVGMVPLFYAEAQTRVGPTNIYMEVSGPMVDVNIYPAYRELCGPQDALGGAVKIGAPQMSMGEGGEITVPVCPRVSLSAYEDNDTSAQALSTQQIMQKLSHTESLIERDHSPDALRSEAFSMFTPYVGSVVERGANLENFSINIDPNKDFLIQLEKRVYRKFYIRYERLFSRTVKESLEARYKFGKRSFLKWGIDQDNQSDFQVEYRLRF